MRGAPAPFLWFPGAHAAGAALAGVHEVAAHSQHPWVPRLPWPCSDPAGGGGCAPGNMGITSGSSRALEAFVVCFFFFLEVPHLSAAAGGFPQPQRCATALLWAGWVASGGELGLFRRGKSESEGSTFSS